MPYQHGVEVAEVGSGLRTIPTSDIGTIFLVSVAPQGDTATPIVIQDASQASIFGVDHPFNYMRLALNQIFQQGSCTVVCANIFNPGDHTMNVTNDVQTVRGGRFRLANLYTQDNSLDVETTASTPVVLGAGTDYEYDVNTQVVRILDRTTYPDGTELRAKYTSVTDDLDDVSDADVIGTVASNVYTGLQVLQITYELTKKIPRYIISPFFETRAAVAAEMVSKAEAYKALALIASPKDATVAEVIAGRGNPGAAVGNFNTASKHAVLLYPWILGTLPYIGETEKMPPSPHIAGAFAVRSLQRGFWFSGDNYALKGVLGLENVLTFDPRFQNNEANSLNAEGVVVVIGANGGGFKIWGARSAAYPSDTSVETQYSIRTSINVISDSLTFSLVQFVGEPASAAQIDNILATINNYFDGLQQQGAVVGYSATFPPAPYNQPADVANGILKFKIEYLPPASTEYILLNTSINTDLAQVLVTPA